MRDMKCVSVGLFAAFFVLCDSVMCAPEAHLYLRTEVDSIVNIERIDNGGAINIFSKEPVSYRIIYNGETGVRVNFRSQNGWKLKKIGLQQDVEHESIPYQGEFKVGSIKEIVDADKQYVNIDNSEFRDSSCTFEVIFSAKKSIKDCAAGSYGDTMTVAVEAL